MTEQIERPDLLPYANEKLGDAVQILATHPGDVKSRLRFAVGPFAQDPAPALPTRLRQEYESIWHELTKRPSKESGLSPVSTILHGMQFKTGAKLAERTFSLSGQVDYLCQHRC